MAQITPALAAALRRSLHRGEVAEVAEPPPPGVLILDDDLRLRAQTSAAKPWLHALTPAGAIANPRAVPPAAVASVAARLLGQEPAWTRTARRAAGYTWGPGAGPW